jgi:exodeoxyribonuclease V alpha subunit
MLFRNLIYTGLTRVKKLAIFVISRRALAIAVRPQDTSLRQTELVRLIKDEGANTVYRHCAKPN